MNFETLAHMAAVGILVCPMMYWAVKSYVENQTGKVEAKMTKMEASMKTELYGSIERNKEKVSNEIKEINEKQTQSHEKLSDTITDLKDFFRDKMEDLKDDIGEIKQNGHRNREDFGHRD